jgi:hypothetical protein
VRRDDENPAEHASAHAASTGRRGRLDTGSASSTRKSVSSGNSEWLTSSVARATTSIGAPMTSVSIAARCGAGVSAASCVAAARMRTRAKSRPNVSIAATMPIRTRAKASDPASERTPKSNSPAKNWAVSRYPARSANRDAGVMMRGSCR